MFRLYRVLLCIFILNSYISYNINAFNVDVLPSLNNINSDIDKGINSLKKDTPERDTSIADKSDIQNIQNNESIKQISDSNKNTVNSLQKSNVKDINSSTYSPVEKYYLTENRKYKGINGGTNHTKVANHNDVAKNTKTIVDSNLDNKDVSKNVEELQKKDSFNKLFNKVSTTTAPVKNTPVAPVLPAEPETPAITKSGSYITGNLVNTLSNADIYRNSQFVLNSPTRRMQNLGVFGFSVSDQYQKGGVNLLGSLGSYTTGYNITLNPDSYSIIIPYFNNPIWGKFDNPLNITNWLSATTFQPGDSGNPATYINNISQHYNQAAVQANAMNASATTTMYAVNISALTNYVTNIPGAMTGAVELIQTLVSNNVYFVNVTTINNNILNLDPNGPMGQILAFIDYTLRPYFAGSNTYTNALYQIVDDANPYTNKAIFTIKQAITDITGQTFTNLDSKISGQALVYQAYTFDTLTAGLHTYSGNNITGYAQYRDVFQDSGVVDNQNLSNGIYNIVGSANMNFDIANSAVGNFAGSLNINLNNSLNTMFTFNLQMTFQNAYLMGGNLVATGHTELLNITGLNTFVITNPSNVGDSLNISGTFAAKDNITGVSAVGAFNGVVNK